MKIGLFGISMSSINYGVTALGISQLKFLEESIKNKNIKAEYYIFSGEDIDKVEQIKKYLDINSKIKIERLINIKYGINGIIDIEKKIKECDIIIDLTYGDSFSDIYGLKKFILFSITKIISIKNKKMLIIGPQTIGPYKSIIAKFIAKKILNKASILCVRDKKSYDLAYKMTKRNDIKLTSDLAMELPFIENKFESKKFKIGINISDLLWSNSNAENLKKYQIVVNYKELVKKIIEKFDKEKYEIHLVTHVYEKDDSKGEYALAKKIHNLYPNTILAPKFSNPIEAKSYMSGLDLFFGARMHATIGAFSSGVPVISTSYSRKFEGLYGSIDYKYGINLRDTTIDKSINYIDKCLENYDKMKKDRDNSYNKALEINKVYHQLLDSVIEGCIKKN